MIRSIITAENPILRHKSKKVGKVTPAVRKLAEDMLETMRAAPGIGLAAVQIGVLQRVVVVELPKPQDSEAEPNPLAGVPIVLVNPEIVEASEETIEGEEGCLSVPGYVGDVERHARVVVKGLDARGRKTRLVATDLMARVLQHELDHLDGVLFLDRLTGPDKLRQVKPGEEERAERQAARVVA